MHVAQWYVLIRHQDTLRSEDVGLLTIEIGRNVVGVNSCSLNPNQSGV